MGGAAVSSLLAVALLSILGELPSVGVGATVISEANIKIAQEQGPNVCVLEEVPGTKHKIWTECKYWADREICGRKATIRYDCCEGYFRVDGEHGCTGVLPLRDLVETARLAGASRFASILESSGLAEVLRRDGAAYTLFAPSDQAMDELTSSQLAALRSPHSDSAILNYHIVPKKQASKSWAADQLVESRLRGASLRINKYSSKIETVNCATIVRKDQEATNGVVHIIDSLLDPEKFQYTDLAEAVVQDGRFRQLARLMQRSVLFETLKRYNVAYTLLAPNDEAFQKLPAYRLRAIEEDEEAREALLKHLVLPHPVCVGAILGPHRFPTRGTERLAFDCDGRGVTVEGLRFGADMQLATDGVLYMLDDLIMPDRVKTLVQLMEEERMFSFLEIVREAGLESMLEQPGHYTLFAPTDAAMATMPYSQLNRIRGDTTNARRFVMLHLARGRILTETITNSQLAQSLDNDNTLRLQVYRKAFGVEDAIIEKPDIQALNGVMHVISKALHPANYTIEEVLQQDGNYTTFLRALNRVRTSHPEALDLQARGGSYTFLVPTDQAFHRLGVGAVQNLMSNTSLLVKTMKNHVVDNMISTESFRENLRYSVPSRQGGLQITKHGDKIRVNDATMLTCDRTNRNGVVHYINKVLLPGEQTTHYGQEERQVHPGYRHVDGYSDSRESNGEEGEVYRHRSYEEHRSFEERVPPRSRVHHASHHYLHT